MKRWSLDGWPRSSFSRIIDLVSDFADENHLNNPVKVSSSAASQDDAEESDWGNCTIDSMRSTPRLENPSFSPEEYQHADGDDSHRED